MKVMLTLEGQMLEWQYKLIKALAFIYKKPSFSDEDFKKYYEDQHAPLAKSLLTFDGYERNYIHSDFNPLFKDLGSISIFKYESNKSLEILSNQMLSDAGDSLRKDELNFMDVEKNFYIFTESKEIGTFKFSKKVFYLARQAQEIDIMNNMRGIAKISDNLVTGHESIVGVPEYAITSEATLRDLELITSEHPQAIFAQSVS
jgi:uncharacterized protein (TIGR02118 family)